MKVSIAVILTISFFAAVVLCQDKPVLQIRKKPPPPIRRAFEEPPQTTPPNPVDPETVPLLVDATQVNNDTLSVPSSSIIVLDGDEPVETTPSPSPSSEVLLPASNMQCHITPNNKDTTLVPEWLLVCHDVDLDSIYFNDQNDCQNTGGLRQCTRVL